MKTTTPLISTLTQRSREYSGSSFVPIVLAVVCFALASTAEAVSPAPDGGYPGANTAEGQNALASLDTSAGIYNTAVGIYSLLSLTNGKFCTAVGGATLLLNTADQNTAVGAGALLSNTTGADNTANGAFALVSNTEGAGNCAFGANALFHNNVGSANCAFGSSALYLNTDGLYNTAIGESALFGNTGSDNTAVGYAALNGNGDGIENTATGALALASTSSGNFNTAIGYQSLAANVTGGTNTAVGYFALGRNTSGANTALGYGAGANVTTGSFNVYIGTDVGGVADEVGHTYISNIRSTVQPAVNGSDYVTIRLADGLLGHTSSSQRYKEDIKPMDAASELLYRLKPVTYHYKKDIDPSQSLDYGLVAEDVAKVDPKLAIRDANGKIESVRYSAIYNMLLNEFLKEHRTVETQQSKIEKQDATIVELKSIVAEQQKHFAATAAQQDKEIQALRASVKEQAAQIQRVGAQVEMKRPRTNVALNNP